MFRAFLSVRIPAILLLGFLLFPSCEKNPTGIIDHVDVSPRIAAPSVSPAIVNTDTINVGPQRLPTDILSIHLLASVIAIPSASSPIQSVSYTYFKEPQLPLVTGELANNGVFPDASGNDSLFSGIIPLSILRSDIGTSFVELSAVDAQGNSSSIARIPFTIVRLNRPPVLSGLSAPDTVHTSSMPSFLITVNVQDPDGLSDIRSVGRTTGGGNTYPLNDSGVNGDVAAGDGIFSETVSLNPPPPEGSYLFTFQALDRSNAGSNILSHTIVVKQ